jgi:ATP-dependent Lon protease
LTIEVAAVKGKGKFITTGSLGDVMKESITAAMTVVRTRADELGIEASRFDETDVPFTYLKVQRQKMVHLQV